MGFGQWRAVVGKIPVGNRLFGFVGVAVAAGGAVARGLCPLVAGRAGFARGYRSGSGTVSGRAARLHLVKPDTVTWVHPRDPGPVGLARIDGVLQPVDLDLVLESGEWVERWTVGTKPVADGLGFGSQR